MQKRIINSKIITQKCYIFKKNLLHLRLSYKTHALITTRLRSTFSVTAQNAEDVLVNQLNFIN